MSWQWCWSLHFLFCVWKQQQQQQQHKVWGFFLFISYTISSSFVRTLCERKEVKKQKRSTQNSANWKLRKNESVKESRDSIHIADEWDEWKTELECNAMAINWELAPDITITYTLRIKIKAELCCCFVRDILFSSFHKTDHLSQSQMQTGGRKTDTMAIKYEIAGAQCKIKKKERERKIKRTKLNEQQTTWSKHSCPNGKCIPNTPWNV